MIMKRKITWKQLFSSSVIRVMCIVIAVMIPVNVADDLTWENGGKSCRRTICVGNKRRIGSVYAASGGCNEARSVENAADRS